MDNNSNNQSWPPSQPSPDTSGASSVPPPPTPSFNTPSFPPAPATLDPILGGANINPASTSPDPAWSNAPSSWPTSPLPGQSIQSIQYASMGTPLNTPPNPQNPSPFGSATYQQPTPPSNEQPFAQPGQATNSSGYPPSVPPNDPWLAASQPSSPFAGQAPTFQPPTEISTPPAIDPAALNNTSGFSDQSNQYVDPNTTAASVTQNQSSLDNPYGVPNQPPSIDGGIQNQQTSPLEKQQETYSGYQQTPQSASEPTWIPPQTSVFHDTSPNTLYQATPAEQAPTDLSHLISNSESNAQAATVQQETAVEQQTNTPEIPSVSTEGKRSIPKWLIGLGVGLLILVAGTSAYFILGVGQSPSNTSIPAAEAPSPVQQVNNTVPTATASAQPTETSTNFGNLQEGTGTPPQASSAADLIKARQQQGL